MGIPPHLLPLGERRTDLAWKVGVVTVEVGNVEQGAPVPLDFLGTRGFLIVRLAVYGGCGVQHVHQQVLCRCGNFSVVLEDPHRQVVLQELGKGLAQGVWDDAVLYLLGDLLSAEADKRGDRPHSAQAQFRQRCGEARRRQLLAASSGAVVRPHRLGTGK